MASKKVTGNVFVKDTALGKEFVMRLYLPNSVDEKRKSKQVATGLPERGNKKKAEKMLAEEIAKYENASKTAA